MGYMYRYLEKLGVIFSPIDVVNVCFDTRFVKIFYSVENIILTRNVLTGHFQGSHRVQNVGLMICVRHKVNE
jgi:hypothetical protein